MYLPKISKNYFHTEAEQNFFFLEFKIALNKKHPKYPSVNGE